MIRFVRAVLALVIAGCAVAASGQTLPEPTCQRACLEGWVDKYLAAMRDRNVDPALFARSGWSTYEQGLSDQIQDIR